MCRNIKTLFNFEPPATSDEVRAASLQYVRKLSGFTRPSKANEAAFELAVERVAAVAEELLVSLVTTAEPRDRTIEAERAKDDRLEQVATEIEGAHLGERKAGLDALEHLAIEAPARAAVVVTLVEERKPRLLQRRQIAPNRPRRDIHIVRQRLDGDAVSRRLESVQDFPLANDFLVTGHGGR